MVEADDGGPDDLDAELLKLLQVGDHVAPHVLELLGFLQALDVWTLDTDEDVEEAGLSGKVEEIIVLGDVYGKLGEEGDALALPAVPVADGLKNLLGLLPVGREVVVGEEHNVNAEPAHLLDLLHDRVERLIAHLTPHIIDDVAELAVEGTAPARLDDPYGIQALGTFTEVRVVRDGADGQVEPLRLMVFPLVPAGKVVGDELWPDPLGLADNEHVGVGAPTLGAERDRGAAADDEYPPPGELSDYLPRPDVLGENGGYPNNVPRGVEVDILEFLIDDRDVELLLGRQGGDGGQGGIHDTPSTLQYLLEERHVSK